MLQNLADAAKKTKFQNSDVVYIRLRKYSKNFGAGSRTATQAIGPVAKEDEGRGVTIVNLSAFQPHIVIYF